MRLLSATFENWGPYYGTQSINFDCERTAPIVLVYGENMRGKTSLLRGLRFALFGSVEGQDGKMLDPAVMANYDARDESDSFEFGVTLMLEHQSEEIEISRRFAASVDNGRVVLGSIRNKMRIVGKNPIPEQDIQEMVSRIIHPDIAEFFLFDGEMLERFEKRLRSDETSAKYLRERIEMVLGVPALRYLKTDIEALIEDTSAAVRKESSQEKTSRDRIKSLEAVEDAQRGLAKDRDQVTQELEETRKVLKSLETQMQEVEAIKEIFFDRKSKEEQIAELDRDRLGIEAEMRAFLQTNWWIPVADRLSLEATKAEEAMVSAGLALDRQQRLAYEAEQIRDQIGKPICEVCGQSVPEEEFGKLKERLSAIEDERKDETIIDISLLQTRFKSLSRFINISPVIEQFDSFDEEIRRKIFRASSLKSEVESLTQSIEGNTVDVSALEKNLQNARGLEDQFERALTGLEEKQAEAVSKRSVLIRSISDLAPSGGMAKAKLQVLEQVEDAVGNAIDRFRDSMRLRVEDEASAIFKRLTSEKDYAGLRIDGSYYLKIYDEQKRPIDMRSAGADQIVTMSLIGALARSAVEEGPIVMDTPFGRLDRTHRSNILKWVAAMNSQVILFVQSGEFERERDVHLLDNRVGREYVLRREGATKTRIEAMSHD